MALVERCFIVLDLDSTGAPLVTIRPFDEGDEDGTRRLVGELGNLLVADLAERKLDPQSRATRNLLVARALDGALPRGGPPAEQEVGGSEGRAQAPTGEGSEEP